MTSAATSRADQLGPTPRLVAPLAFVMLAAFALCAAFGYLLARESDVRHQGQQRASLVGVIDEFRAVFADITLRAATSPALAVRDATERMLAPLGMARYRHQHAYLVDADGGLISSFPPAGVIPPAIARTIAAFRANHDDAGADVESVRVATDFTVIDDQPALAAMAFVAAPMARDGPAILVRVTRLDRGLIGAFEAMSGVAGISFEADAPQDGRDVQSLLDRQGRIVGWLSWNREHPTMNTVLRLAPLLATVTLCLIVFAALAIRQIGRATRRLAVSEAEAHTIAYEDPITRLPNRRKILDVLDAALAARTADEVVSFGLMDIDGYKDIRESVGEQGASALLAEAGARLRAAVPEVVTLGRIGDDEFAVVARAGADGLAAAQAALKAMERPFWVANQAVQSNLTIGLARAPADGASRAELMRRADLARRALKGGEHGRIGSFAREMEQEFEDRLFIKRELRRALAEKAFEVHYQPIVAAEGQRIVGVEALLRWNHASRGFIPPVEFIPVAEQTGMMMQLGEFALRRALADAAAWPDIYVAVNLSPVQVRDRGIVRLVAEAIGEARIAPSRVVLEVTEGVLIENPDEARERLDQLRGLGVKIALDDFGSGYSSLSYLRRFPIDKLKIDKQFVAPLGRSSDGGVIIQAIMALGRALGLSVLCEGVETEEQRILLRLAGCDEMQGFLFAKPAPRAAIERLLMGAGGERKAARA